MRNILESDNRIVGNTISFIDIDETTFHTFAKVGVYNDGKLVRKLDNKEFNTYSLQPGEYYDFNEFADSEVFNKTSTPIKPIVDRICSMINSIKLNNKLEKVIFLTARSDFNDKELFLKTFRQNGIDVDIENVYIERSGNLREIKSVAERKKYVILKYLKSGLYTAVRMFDDDKTNLATFIELGKEINQGKYGILETIAKKYARIQKVYFYPLLVNGNGKIQRLSLTESFQTLLEGIEEVKKYYPLINDNDLHKLVKFDPTYKGGNELGTYGKWILNLYNNFLKDRIAYKKWQDQIKLGNSYPKPVAKSEEKIEDFEKIPNLLKKFDAIKNKVKLNINNIKSVSQLYATIENTLSSESVSDNSDVQHSLDLVKKSVANGGEIIYRDKQWMILVPKTFESSKVFGSDTNWCTTSSSGYYYDYYKNKHGGVYFINVNLEDGSLYQFHFESDQFMDSSDHHIDMDEFGNENPKLKDFYIDYLNNVIHKELPINERINNALNDENKLKEIFSTIQNLQLSPEGIKGQLDIEDIKTDNYDNDYETFDGESRGNVSLKFIEKVLNGTVTEDWDFYDVNVIDSFDERLIEENLDNCGVTYDDIVNIYNNDFMGGDEEVDLPLELKQDIYELLDESFYEGMGVHGVLEQCSREGTESEVYSDILYGLQKNLPLTDDQPIEDESTLNVFIKEKDVKEIIKSYLTYGESKYKSDNWYEKWSNDGIEDEETPWLYLWRDIHYSNPEWSIREPYYGWSGFDRDMWEEAQIHFCKRVKSYAQMILRKK